MQFFQKALLQVVTEASTKLLYCNYTIESLAPKIPTLQNPSGEHPIDVTCTFLWDRNGQPETSFFDGNQNSASWHNSEFIPQSKAKEDLKLGIQQY